LISWHPSSRSNSTSPQITRDRNNQNILVLEILSAKPSRGPARRTPLLFLRQTTGIRNATIKPNYLSGTLNS
jgi:hypothetical protein